MRFGKPTRRPSDGEERIFRHFLWLPVTIGGETRWLETADINYRYERSGYVGDEWVPIRFINH
jgi:hypothetical protein